MDYNEINDEQLDVIGFTEFEKFKKELILPDTNPESDNLSQKDTFQINLNKSLSDINEKSNKIRCEKSKFKCEICNRVFLSTGKYERHKFFHFKKCVLQCNECGMLSKNRPSLINHIKVHHLNVQDKREDCRICGKSVLRMGPHMRQHTDAIFQCDKCGKCFRSNSYYIEHYKTHFEIKEFHCQICGSDFTRKWYYRIHMKKHEENKNGVLYLQIKRRGVHGSRKYGKSDNTNIDQRTVACDTSDLQSIAKDGCVTLFPLRKWEENQTVSPFNLMNEKWINALFSSQSVDTSDIDYYFDLLEQSSN